MGSNRGNHHRHGPGYVCYKAGKPEGQTDCGWQEAGSEAGSIPIRWSVTIKYNVRNAATLPRCRRLNFIYPHFLKLY